MEQPKININYLWELNGYNDAEYSRDNDTWNIITGYVILINLMKISWNFWIQKTVTPLVTESEYLAIMCVCYEILFTHEIWSVM